jgi:hypothetical protein
LVTGFAPSLGFLENQREIHPGLGTGHPVRIHSTLTKHPGLLYAFCQVIPFFIDRAAPDQQIESVPGKPAIVATKSEIVSQGRL